MMVRDKEVVQPLMFERDWRRGGGGWGGGGHNLPNCDSHQVSNSLEDGVNECIPNDCGDDGVSGLLYLPFSLCLSAPLSD